MDIGALLTAVFNSPSFTAIYLCLLFSIADFAIGSLRAVQNGSFLLSRFGSWIKADGPPIGIIFTWLLLGQAVSLVDPTNSPLLPPDLVAGALIGYGLIQAATFVLSKLDSIRGSVDPQGAAERETKAIQSAQAHADTIPHV